jgi:hypothetical protein
MGDHFGKTLLFSQGSPRLLPAKGKVPTLYSTPRDFTSSLGETDASHFGGRVNHSRNGVVIDFARQPRHTLTAAIPRPSLVSQHGTVDEVPMA